MVARDQDFPPCLGTRRDSCRNPALKSASIPRKKAVDLTETTVIIPSYNSSATIEAAVQSALAQTVPVNVITVDDGSRDDTVQKLQALARENSRLCVLQQPRNQGPSAARNRAIAAAETPWIAILDADDYMHPDRIRRMLQVARAESLDIVADDLIRVADAPSPITGTRLWSDDPIGCISIDLARFVRENIGKNTGSRRELGYLKPLMRVGFLKTHGIAYDESMRLAEDYDLYARALSANARFGLIDPCGYFSVDYPNSLSKAYTSTELRPIVDTDIALLRKRHLSRDERQAISAHKALAHKQWAWVRLIEMTKKRDFRGAVRTFAAPPEVTMALVLRLCRHALGRDTIPHSGKSTPKRQAIEAMLAESNEQAGCHEAPATVLRSNGGNI